MKATAPTKALIYCRVSSTKQAVEGHGLDSQEHRCRDYAAARGYEVEAVFPDDVTGGGDFMKRPGMVALISYLDAQRDRKAYVVIFDDLKRFARDTEFHIQLRRAFKLRGASVECLNFRFEDTPEGKFVETIFAKSFRRCRLAPRSATGCFRHRSAIVSRRLPDTASYWFATSR
jgi:DNA invertase Pin-like site-specific DNA recombinase